MTDVIKIPTSAEVWAVIRARHPELVPCGSYSAPCGDHFGDPSKGVMKTSYAFPDADFPIIAAETTWTIDREDETNRIDEQHRYWLCVGTKE